MARTRSEGQIRNPVGHGPSKVRDLVEAAARRRPCIPASRISTASARRSARSETRSSVTHVDRRSRSRFARQNVAARSVGALRDTEPADRLHLASPAADHVIGIESSDCSTESDRLILGRE